MKVLCPSDFSKTSINAIQWVCKYLKEYEVQGVEVTLLHSLLVKNRFNEDVKHDFLIEKAERDLSLLIDLVRNENPDVKLESQILLGDIRNILSDSSYCSNFDLIVLGSTGLSEVKAMVLGSVASYVAENSHVPVLVIPKTAKYEGMESILFAVDDSPMKMDKGLTKFQAFFKLSKPDVKIVQVVDHPNKELKVDERITKFLFDFDYDIDKISGKGGVIKVLDLFADYMYVDLICMIHHEKNWLGKLFKQSFTKAHFFHLELPIFIIPDKLDPDENQF